jgi:hypothetical protein
VGWRGWRRGLEERVEVTVSAISESQERAEDRAIGGGLLKREEFGKLFTKPQPSTRFEISINLKNSQLLTISNYLFKISTSKTFFYFLKNKNQGYFGLFINF